MILDRRCLYCDEPAGSREHILASGMGGRFTRSDIICAYHNGLCGKWADDPFCEQFAIAIHALEVLKGDGQRGTTLPLIAEDGTKFDSLPDFRFRMHHTVDRDAEGGFLITATDANVHNKLAKQLSAISNHSSTRTEERTYHFSTPFATHGPGMRGVLKAALHFLSTVADDYDRARAICAASSTVIFSDAEPDNVTVVPYDVTDHEREVNRHEMLAWNDQNETLVRVKLFNLVTYLVRLPYLSITPRVYRQNTQDGSRSLRTTLVPHLIVQQEMATAEGFRTEFIRRVDSISNLGAYKSDIADILDEAIKQLPFRTALGYHARTAMLGEALRQRMAFREGPLPNWAAKELIAFSDRRIAELSRCA
jgi:hypothetical protein